MSNYLCSTTCMIKIIYCVFVVDTMYVCMYVCMYFIIYLSIYLPYVMERMYVKLFTMNRTNSYCLSQMTRRPVHSPSPRCGSTRNYSSTSPATTTRPWSGLQETNWSSKPAKLFSNTAPSQLLWASNNNKLL